MCAACAAEYHDPANRRFHAQPVCCPACGPRLRLLDTRQHDMAGDPLAAAAAAAAPAGQVLAVKGLGGYHLAVDAAQRGRGVGAAGAQAPRGQAVRGDGRRPGGRAGTVRGGRDGRALLASAPAADRAAAAPARRRRSPRAVAPGNRQLGVMLPYTPLHHLLLAAVGRPIVLTSGNVSDEPIAYRDDDALARLAGIADAFLTHDRAIHIRTDDSVVRPFRGRETLLRRSRGYAPEPLGLAARLPPAGAGLRRGAEEHVLPGRGGPGVRLPPHRRPGELRDAAVVHRRDRALPAAVRHRAGGGRARPAPGVPVHQVRAGPRRRATWSACSTTTRTSRPAWPTTARTGPVIGVAFDGTGFGTDGTIWGGEFLLADLAGFERAGHLEPVPMPGGAAAIRQPWRMAAAYLDAAYAGELPGRPGWSPARNAGRWPDVLAMARRGHQRAAHLQRGPAVRRGRRAARGAGHHQLRGPGRDRARAAGRPGRARRLPCSVDRRGGPRRRPARCGTRRRPGAGGGRGSAGRRRARGHRRPVPPRGGGRHRARSARRCGSGPGWARWRCPAACSRTCCCSARSWTGWRRPGSGCSRTRGCRPTTAGSASARRWWPQPATARRAECRSVIDT